MLGWCRGAELNCLRRPFQGRALPVSYLGTGMNKDCTDAFQTCQFGLNRQKLKLFYGFVEFAHPVFFLQHFARTRAVGRADDSIFLHQVD